MDIAQRAKMISPSLTLEITAKAKRLRDEGVKVISFAAGEPDFNTPDFIVEAAFGALKAGKTKYTAASGILELKKAICQKFKKDNGLSYEPSQIVVSNGAKHSLFNALFAILEPKDEVIIPAPYWLSYPELVRMSGGVPVILKTDAQSEFKITKDSLAKVITNKTKAIIFNSPSNPTGTVYTKQEIQALAEVIQANNIYVISDEIYEKMTYVGEHYSIAAFSDTLYERTIVVNGMSKAYAMTGWRIGYTASNKTVAAAMANIQSHATSNPNTVAQWASLAALVDPRGEQFLSELKQTFDERRRLMIDRLKSMNADFIEPKGAFYVMLCVKKFFGKSFKGQAINSAYDFAALLLDNMAVAAIPCESFGADDYVRLSYASSKDDIIKGLDCIKTFMQGIE